MAILIDPDEDPIERSFALCSEVSFEIKQDLFTIEFPDSYDQHEDVPFKTTVIFEQCLIACNMYVDINQEKFTFERCLFRWA